MLVNHERLGGGGNGADGFGGGLGIYDVSTPENPQLITKWRTAGKGVHRFTFDGRYAYISPTVEGYVGNIVMILDLADPTQPEEVGRWWIPGQWQAGGEEYPWADWVAPRCHHPLRLGDRLYVSYWHHGLFILDIEDMARPKHIAGRQHQPGLPAPDPHLPALSAPAQGPPHHGGGRRGRGEALAVAAGLRLGSTTSPTSTARSRSARSTWMASIRMAALNQT